MANWLSRLIMVIELTDTLLEYSLDEENRLINSLTNLLISYYEGNHIIMATPAICDVFASKLTDLRAKEALNHVSKNLYHGYEVRWRIKVVLKNANELNYEMDYTRFEKSQSVQPTFFICENLADIDFYIYLTKYYNPTVELRSINTPGGGDTTCEIFSYHRRRSCFTLAIVDSDIKFPGGRIGTTAEKCQKKSKHFKANSCLIILPCHEVENMLPHSFFIEFSSTAVKRFLQKLKICDKLDILKFYDIKNGIIKEHLENFPEYKLFAEELYCSVYGKKKGKHSFQQFYDSKSSKDKIFPAINPKALDKFLKEKPQFYSDLFEPERREVCDIILTCLCARGDGPMY